GRGLLAVTVAVRGLLAGLGLFRAGEPGVEDRHVMGEGRKAVRRCADSHASNVAPLTRWVGRSADDMKKITAPNGNGPAHPFGREAGPQWRGAGPEPIGRSANPVPIRCPSGANPALIQH